ncbi:Na+/H+ antiporter NhaA [Kocuria rhizophila]|nr:Na+/H+ antiporter NhaA [Kocuria rhizophila]
MGLQAQTRVRRGDLRDLSKAAVPIAAAVGGVVVPALDPTRW